MMKKVSVLMALVLLVGLFTVSCKTTAPDTQGGGIVVPPPTTTPQGSGIPAVAVKASSVQEAGLEAKYAIDGDEDTRWSSAWKDKQYIYIDLGDKKSFTTVVLNWETAYGESYEIQISDDGVNWKTIYATTSSMGGEDIIPVGKQKARYVKMYGIKRGTEWGFSLWEFQVK